MIYQVDFYSSTSINFEFHASYRVILKSSISWEFLLHPESLPYLVHICMIRKVKIYIQIQIRSKWFHLSLSKKFSMSKTAIWDVGSAWLELSTNEEQLDKHQRNDVTWGKIQSVKWCFRSLRWMTLQNENESNFLYSDVVLQSVRIFFVDFFPEIKKHEHIFFDYFILTNP